MAIYSFLIVADSDYCVSSCVDNASTPRLSVRCARCVLYEKCLNYTQTFRCNGCDQIQHVTNLDFVAAKQFLANERRRHLWKYHECLHPACVLCKVRPMQAITHKLVDGKYYCNSCKFPPCKICGKVRDQPKSTQRFLEYICVDCCVTSKQNRCTECKQTKTGTEFDFRRPGDRHTRCRDCHKNKC